jgi:hypothetical protein
MCAACGDFSVRVANEVGIDFRILINLVALGGESVHLSFRICNRGAATLELISYLSNLPEHKSC